VCHKHVACNKGLVSKTAIAMNHLIASLVSTATAEKKNKPTHNHTTLWGVGVVTRKPEKD